MDEHRRAARDPPGPDRAPAPGVVVKDRVHGVGFSYECHIGFHDYERQIRQRVVVDFEAETDWRAVARQDNPDPAALVDYYEVNRRVRELVEHRAYNLVEALAEDVARLLCASFPVSRVRVRATKTPFGMPNAVAVSVECWRSPEDFAEPT